MEVCLKMCFMLVSATSKSLHQTAVFLTAVQEKDLGTEYP